jgi:hypothetical protein
VIVHSVAAGKESQPGRSSADAIAVTTCGEYTQRISKLPSNGFAILLRTTLVTACDARDSLSRSASSNCLLGGNERCHHGFPNGR